VDEERTRDFVFDESHINTHFSALLKRRETVEQTVKKINARRFSKTEEERFLELQMRILLSHLNHPLKLRQLKRYHKETTSLGEKFLLHLPREFLQQRNEEGEGEGFRNFDPFSFFPYKEQRRNDFSRVMKSLFTTTDNSSTHAPFPGDSYPLFPFPHISHGFERFLTSLRNGEPTLIVSGFCPASFLSGDIRIRLEGKTPSLPLNQHPASGEMYLREKDVKTGTGKGEHVGSPRFPPTPLLSDVVYLERSFQLAETMCQSTGNRPDIVFWFPFRNYCEEFSNLMKQVINETGITVEQKDIESGFSLLKKRYALLVEFMKTRYPDIRCRVVEDGLLREGGGEVLGRKRQALDFISYHYGRYRFPDEKRKILYKDIVLMHSHFVEKNFNTLHLENSYELWPNFDAARYLRKTKASGNFSWLCYPAVPSLCLRYLRDFNALADGKIYLFDEIETSQEKLQRGRADFLSLVYASLYPGQFYGAMKNKARSRKKRSLHFRQEIGAFLESFTSVFPT